MDHTEWHLVEAWNKQAEICQNLLSKGDPVYVLGEKFTDSWEDQDGKPRQTVKLKATMIVPL